MQSVEPQQSSTGTPEQDTTSTPVSPRRAVLLGSLKAAAYMAPATLAVLAVEARAAS